jgi:hypothetical protein
MSQPNRLARAAFLLGMSACGIVLLAVHAGILPR